MTHNQDKNKSIGTAANPIPPNKANNSHETNNKTAIAYIMKFALHKIKT